MTEFSAKSLERSTASRLKWRVCRLMGIKPYSSEWKRLTRRRVVMCAAMLVSEMEGLRRDDDSGEANPHFDERRFEELRRGEHG